MKKIIQIAVDIATEIGRIFYSFKFRPFVIRKGTTDIRVFTSIFILRDLSIKLNFEPKLIIDGGAYTGLSTMFYATKYKNAKLVAVEPENSNFKVLEINTKNIENVIRIKAGIWNRNCSLKVVDRETGKWGFMLKEVNGGEGDIEAITIEEILKQTGFKEIDILKLDIEGSEKEVFSQNYFSWLEKTKVLVIELHDRFKEGCTDAVLKAIDPDKWKRISKGDKMIFVRKSINL